ncbi:MAG: cellulose biosynthesis protein BcsN, partial [Bauldia sp.]|nr:cellulose biosynthesis protein BcsN [Bauldia sp.]
MILAEHIPSGIALAARRVLARRDKALFLALAVMCSLAGCAAGPRVAGVATELPANDSFVTLPPGGPATISVLEKKFNDAVVRETILATNSRVSGQNFLNITLYGPVGYRTIR